MTRETPIETQTEELNRELTPEEIMEQLSEIKAKYCTELREETGIDVIFPKGTKIGDIDVSGMSLEEVINLVQEPLESYEPPIIQEKVEEQVEQEAVEVPEWLRGHEDLIWKGAHENPIWEVQGEQHDDEVIVSYMRKGKELKPGRTKFEQERELEAVKNNFTLDEWKIVKQIFDEYKELEVALQEGDKETKKAAKKQILEILKEENAFRKGRGEVPQILTNKMSENMEDVAKKSRGFKKEKIDLESITQQTAEILSQLLVLNRTRGEGKERVPKLKPDIKEIPSFEYSLSLLVNCFDEQLDSKKGLTLMVGEAGTGKNEALEFFAAKTNRPFFWFPCGRGMEAIDLVAHYEFDTKEGTKRFLSDLAEGIQTPGAVVMIDEVNALKPEVQAMLHGLGDTNRSLNYDGVHIPVAEGAIVVIAGNPATYGSAGDIGQALLSRTRGQSMIMEYPAFKKGELLQREEQWSNGVLEQKETEDNTLRDYACDEALVLYPILNEFSNLDDQEFELMWDCVINESTQGSKITELERNEKLKKLLEGPAAEHVRRTLIDLRDIIRIADAWRKSYERRTGGLDIIGVSLRDTIAVARAYKREGNVRKAYMKVMNDFRKNPIEGLDYTLKSLEQLIDDTLGQKPE